MRTRELARMTWVEAQQALQQDPVVLIPMGTIEQHGPHLPMGADTLVAESVARAATKATNSIVTPSISFGYCANSRTFPGTINWDPPLLTLAIEQTVQSLAKHGARRFIIVNNHRSNAGAVQQSAYTLRSLHQLVIGSFFPWGTMIAIARKEHPTLSEAIGHGGEPESSVMLHLCPGDVTAVNAEIPRRYSDYQGLTMKNAMTAIIDGQEVNLFRDLSELTSSGVNGDPTQPDASRGEELLNRTSATLAKFIEHMTSLKIGEG